MATSGTKTFDLPIDEIINEATERVGGKWDSSEEMDSAIRSLNLTFQDLMNRGKPLFTVEQKTTTVLTSVRDYALSAGITQIVGSPILRVQSSTANGPTDYALNRIGFLDYNNISQKGVLGRPSMFTVEQRRDDILVRLWPTPTSGASDPGWSLVYYGVEAPDTVTKLFQDPDIQRRYLSCIVDGLAYYMSLKRPEISMDRITMFKNKFEESVVIAFGEDREQVSHIVRPYTSWWN